VADQVLKKTDWTIWPLHKQQTVLTKLILCFKDSQIIFTDIADKLDISYGSAYYIIHEGLGYQNLCKVGAKAAYK